jgi:hypothetical protein
MRECRNQYVIYTCTCVCVCDVFFCSPILFAICTITFSKLCKRTYKNVQWHVEECSVALI